MTAQDRTAASVSPKFAVGLSVTHTLSVNDIWPDGDAPLNPTAQDVAATMRAYGSQRRTIMEWNLDDDLEVTVDGISVW